MKWETNTILLVVMILVTVSIGGIVEIAPLFTIESTIEEVEGVRPYTPLELAGRRIYIREGCYNCHSQMIRPFRDEVERYGHYSIAAESMYDHPFQWGSKRTGPDLARVGGKYSNDWHVAHFINPREVVPESIMPPYAFLAETDLGFRNIADHLRANAAVGVPYTDEMIEAALQDMTDQASNEADWNGLFARYSPFPEDDERHGTRINTGDFDGDPGRLTEMDAIVAYMQVLGTLVDFSEYTAEDLRQ